jgi:hypothetical protein
MSTELLLNSLLVEVGPISIELNLAQEVFGRDQLSRTLASLAAILV